jgi:hypothetical protein
MKQVFFHSLVVCFFLPFLGVIAFSLNSFGFPLMEQYSDKSIKFFIAFPYFLLVMAGLVCVRVCCRSFVRTIGREIRNSG